MKVYPKESATTNFTQFTKMMRWGFKTTNPEGEVNKQNPHLKRFFAGEREYTADKTIISSYLIYNEGLCYMSKGATLTPQNNYVYGVIIDFQRGEAKETTITIQEALNTYGTNCLPNGNRYCATIRHHTTCFFPIIAWTNNSYIGKECVCWLQTTKGFVLPEITDDELGLFPYSDGRSLTQNQWKIWLLCQLYGMNSQGYASTSALAPDNRDIWNIEIDGEEVHITVTGLSPDNQYLLNDRGYIWNIRGTSASYDFTVDVSNFFVIRGRELIETDIITDRDYIIYDPRDRQQKNETTEKLYTKRNKERIIGIKEEKGRIIDVIDDEKLENQTGDTVGQPEYNTPIQRGLGGIREW